MPGRRRFQGADLTGANLCGATVSRANFRGAKAEFGVAIASQMPRRRKP
ncbi:pentapeptide repeat-containing protein [Bradyrhizobium tunisiense]